MPRRKLRMTLKIGPCGFRDFPILVKFTDKKEDLAALARGEGQALQFVLEDGDFSAEFHEALERGEVLEVLSAENWELRVEQKCMCCEGHKNLQAICDDCVDANFDGG